MLDPQLITPQNLIPLFVSTFQGSSTQEVNEAFVKLLQTAKNHSNPFINSCQKILQTQKLSKHLCQSVSNLIKRVTKIMIDHGYIYEHGPKDYINKIQRIFDNSKIPIEYKEDIAMSYMKAAIHFRISFEKVIGRVSFLYKNNQSQLGILLSRAYLTCQSRVDTKSQNFYYNKILPLQLKYLSNQLLQFQKLLEQGNKNQFQRAQRLVKNIHQVLSNIHLALINIAFQKFQTSIFNCLKNKDIIQIVNSLPLLKQNNKTIIIFREIVQKVIESLYRMRRMHIFPVLIQALSLQLHQEWKEYQQTLVTENSVISNRMNFAQSLQTEQQISKIKLLTSVINSHLILILDDQFDILNVLVRPLFQIRTQLFQKTQYDAKQIYLNFIDICFSMQSGSLEVQFNRFVKSLLANNQIISSKVYFTLDQLLFNNPEFQLLLQNKQNQVIMLLNLVAFQTSYFMTNNCLLAKVQVFIRKYESILFDQANTVLYFHSLLIMCNYQDDIFCEQLNTKIFQKILYSLVQKKLKHQEKEFNSQQKLISYLQKTISQEFFKAGFTVRQIQKESSILIGYLTENFDKQLMSIYIEMMRHYNIQDRVTLEIFDRMLESINQKLFIQNIKAQGSHECVHCLIKFLETFFGMDIYKHLFESTLSRILPIFQILIQKLDLYMEEFFTLIKNVISHLQYVPEYYLSWMANLFNSERLKTEESFKSLVLVLKYLLPSKQNKNLKYEIFVNCVALNLLQTIVKSQQTSDLTSQNNQIMHTFQQNNSFKNVNQNCLQKEKQFFAYKSNQKYSKTQILALLSLHQLIYNHCGYFTKKILEQIIRLTESLIIAPQTPENSRNYNFLKENSHFSFVRGKYQLIFVLLFRRRLADVNQILIQLGLQKKVYDAVYMRDNQYLIEYDTPILIKEQSQILRKLIFHDKLQMSYANTSFLTIFYKFYILFGIKTNYKKRKQQYVDLQSSDSDQERFETVSQFKKNLKEVAKTVQSFPLPEQWSQINQLKQIKQFVIMLRSNESSRQWLNSIIANCLTKKQKLVMEEVLKDLQNVNGKYRHIIKVNKSSLSQSSNKINNRDVLI